MTTKLKAILSAAAALVIAGGITIGQALYNANQAQPPEQQLTCTQWARATRKFRDQQNWERFFVAIQNGTSIPKAYNGRLLGDCAAGVCTIQPTGCPHPATYTYTQSPLVNGWRLFRVYGHPYVVKGWKLAAEGEAGIKWFASARDVVTTCKAHFTNQQCLDLLEADNYCFAIDSDEDGVWEMDPDGDMEYFCRHGRKYGPGLGGSEACDYAEVDFAMPCNVNRGAGSEINDVNRVFVDEDFDNI